MNEVTNADRQENYRMEYKELGPNLRFYGGLRFIVAAFAMTLQSAFLAFYSQALQRPTPPIPNAIIFGAGIVTMVAVSIIDLRSIILFSMVIERGKELEFNLGLPDGQYSRLNKITMQLKGFRWFITHTGGIWLTYGVIFTLWNILMIQSYLP